MTASVPPVVSDALQTLVERIDAHFRTAPNRSYGKNPYELSEGEWSQLRALAQTRRLGPMEG